MILNDLLYFEWTAQGRKRDALRKLEREIVVKKSNSHQGTGEKSEEGMILQATNSDG